MDFHPSRGCWLLYNMVMKPRIERNADKDETTSINKEESQVLQNDVRKLITKPQNQANIAESAAPLRI